MSMGNATDEQENKREIRAVLAARAAARRAKDASQFVAAFDPSVVKFDLAPPLQEAGPAVCDPAGLQWWLDTWDGEVQTGAPVRTASSRTCGSDRPWGCGSSAASGGSGTSTTQRPSTWMARPGQRSTRNRDARRWPGAATKPAPSATKHHQATV
jgi:hypothetical protein